MDPLHEPTYTAPPESSAAIPKSTKVVSRHLGLASKVVDFPVMLAWATMKSWLVVLSLVVSAHPNPIILSPVVPILVVPSPVVSKVLPPSTVLPLMATTILCVWAAHNSLDPSEVAVTSTASPEAAATATAPSERVPLVPLLVLLKPIRPSLNPLPAVTAKEAVSELSACPVMAMEAVSEQLPALSCSYGIY